MASGRHRTGDVGETAFAYRATQAGLKVAKPLSSKESYDYIVDNGRRCWRVQVKATDTLASKMSYRINCGKGADQKYRYEEGEIDFLVIHVIPEDTFFILPWEALKGRVGLSVPSARWRDLGAFAEHLGRWDLLLGAGVAAESIVTPHRKTGYSARRAMNPQPPPSSLTASVRSLLPLFKGR
jgi:hypothetical protein